MAPDKLENGAQCCFNKFNRRLFISKFSQFAIFLSLSLSVISKRLTQPCCKCCSLSLSVVVNVRFTTNGMCMKNNSHVTWTSRNKMNTTWDFYCLLPQCEALRTCCSAFSITTTMVWPGCEGGARHKPSQKERAIGAVHCKNEGMLSQPLGWRCIDSVVLACIRHENDQRWTCTWI